MPPPEEQEEQEEEEEEEERDDQPKTAVAEPNRLEMIAPRPP